MSRNHLTEDQVESGERYLKGGGDRNDAALWSKARGRLRGEENWRALVDLCVREIVLAGVENGDPYVLYELAREVLDRMEPWLHVRLQRDLHELLKDGPGMGVPLGTKDFPEAVTQPEAVPLIRLLATQEAWNERTELKPKAKEKEKFTSHKVTNLLKILERDGAIRRWTERVKSGKRGRPREVRKVALTPQGKAYLATFGGPPLGPGTIRTRRYWRPRPLDERALRRVVRDALERVSPPPVGPRR